MWVTLTPRSSKKGILSSVDNLVWLPVTLATRVPGWLQIWSNTGHLQIIIRSIPTSSLRCVLCRALSMGKAFLASSVGLAGQGNLMRLLESLANRFVASAFSNLLISDGQDSCRGSCLGGTSWLLHLLGTGQRSWSPSNRPGLLQYELSNLTP